MENSGTTVIKADLSLPDHQRQILDLLNGYSMDMFGDGKPLSATARADLIPRLQQHPTTRIFIAYQDGAPAGIAICFLGFSTFAARPLLNIHDYFVSPAYRGKSVGRILMQEVERHAREEGCCKLTLEVLENNRRARSVYAAAGFERATYVPEAGSSFFLTKPLR